MEQYYASCLFCEEGGYFAAGDPPLCDRCYDEVEEIRFIDENLDQVHLIKKEEE